MQPCEYCPEQVLLTQNDFDTKLKINAHVNVGLQ